MWPRSADFQLAKRATQARVHDHYSQHLSSMQQSGLAYLTGLRKGQQKNNLMLIENLATLGTLQRFLGKSAEYCVDFGTEYQFYWQVW